MVRVVKERQVHYDLKTGELKTLMDQVICTTKYLEIHQVCADVFIGDRIDIEPIDECRDELEIMIEEDGRACIYGANLQILCDRIQREAK